MAAVEKYMPFIKLSKEPKNVVQKHLLLLYTIGMSLCTLIPIAYWSTSGHHAYTLSAPYADAPSGRRGRRMVVSGHH